MGSAFHVLCPRYSGAQIFKFMLFFTVFQSYQEDGGMIIK